MLDFQEDTAGRHFVHASVDVLGRLPRGDGRIWAQTLTDVVAAAYQSGGLGAIRQAGGATLSPDDIDLAWTQLAEGGVAPGDTIIVAAENTLATTARLLALWLHGVVVVPVDPALPEDTRAIIARVSEAQAFVDVAGKVTRYECTPAAPLIRMRRPLRVTGSDVAMMIFTSGSSGTPKGVELSHTNVMSALRAIASYQRLGPDDRIMAIPPFFFDYGLYQLFLSLFTGCGLILSGAVKAVSKLAPMIAREEPTVLPVVPALATGIARVLDITGRQVDSVRLITNTGGHMPEVSIAVLRQVFPSSTAMPMYGLTECKRAMYCDRSHHVDAAESCGVAMPGLLAAVLVEDAGTPRAAKTGETGELYVRGSSVMQGYRGDTSTASARLITGAYRNDIWLATGDLMSRNADGLHFFRGRSKTLIKQAGYCILPRDLEQMAEALNVVCAATVVGRTEDNGDESAVMFVELSPAGAGLDARALKARLKAHLPASLMPRVVSIVDVWPATPNGKVCQKTLTAIAKDVS
ncbi:acyl--CoA ligase [Sagittula sp. NFXS13]|uniref:class I adenylate-forming enzyme family protein n=1 Tax=Sagittula sp. NFXS13 TaxID=2819095 RepID=UPI0032DFFDA8